MVIKIKKSLLLKILLVVSIILVFSISIYLIKNLNAKDVDKSESEIKILIENHYKYMNEKDVDNHFSLLADKRNLTAEDKRNTKDLLENIEYVKPVKIQRSPSEESSLKSLNQYKHIKQENLRVYKVSYDIKFKNENLGLVPNGKNSTTFYIVRESDSSPWLIDSSEGQGY